jgi:hypothetical protein
LLNEKIEVSINNKEAARYRALGYDVYGKKACIYPMDLPRYSSRMILLKCDTCGKIYEEHFCNYLNRKKIADKGIKDECPICLEHQIFVHIEYSNILKDSMRPWRNDTLEHFDYKCEITGLPTYTVHHICDFSSLLKLSLKRLGISIHDFNTRYDELFTRVKYECLKVHYEFGLGATLIPGLHKLFHSIYSTHAATPEQFEEFKRIIKQLDIDWGKFDITKGMENLKEKFLAKRNSVLN